jgi:hypothetical protein
MPRGLIPWGLCTHRQPREVEEPACAVIEIGDTGVVRGIKDADWADRAR